MAMLPDRITESVERAVRNLEPARIGWSVVDDDRHTFCRRFIRRPDKMIADPFGGQTVRANMHPGYQNSEVIGPAGPVDPLTLLSIQSRAGRPIAMLANYSMHYFGTSPVSADYFGRFATALAARIGADKAEPPFVGIMSQGTSGDQMWMDYSQPKNDIGLGAYALEIARGAYLAYQKVVYHDWVPLAIAESMLVLDRRVPDESRLKWVRGIIAEMRGRDVPRSLPEVYAREAIFLHEEPRRELKLQALRIGEFGITAIPNEVFAITGLKLKIQSPFVTTMNITLANGSEGYIPPPEQHALGGYTTWPARTAALEVQAEPKIVSAMLALLEKVASTTRRPIRVPNGDYSKAVLASRPLAYWRLDDIHGPIAQDYSSNTFPGIYEGSIAFFLPGGGSAGLAADSWLNRSVHFAGGRLKSGLASVGPTYTVELWFWNGLPKEVRPISGYLVLCAIPEADQLGIGGTQLAPGRLFFAADDRSTNALSGKTEIAQHTWHYLVLAREESRVTIYLDGSREPEISGAAAGKTVNKPTTLLIGGRHDGSGSFEGKIDEIAVYERVLTTDEVGRHYHAAQGSKVSKHESSR